MVTKDTWDKFLKEKKTKDGDSQLSFMLRYLERNVKTWQTGSHASGQQPGPSDLCSIARLCLVSRHALSNDVHSPAFTFSANPDPNPSNPNPDSNPKQSFHRKSWQQSRTYLMR